MIQNVLRTLGGIENYGVLSLCLFALVFAGTVVWAFLQKRAYLDRMARVPLDADPSDLPTGKESHD